MPNEPAPLFAQRAPSENSADDTRQEEEDALLTGQSTGKKTASHSDTRRNWREIGVFAWALLATAAVVILAVVYQHNLSSQHHPSNDNNNDPPDFPKGKRNLIFMVSDGMGPTSLALTRSWRQYTDQLPYDSALILDDHLIGQSRTRSSSSLVTDSAAGATAFSCGQKSYNGAISVLPDHSPCGTVMEAAKRAGYTTGLVVTTRVTDATPAVFASHVRNRDMEDGIAVQMLGLREGGSGLGRSVDLIMGGGRCHFVGNGSEGSCREDGRNLVGEGEREEGWGFVGDRAGFDALGKGSAVKLPLLALLAEEDVPYEIDRRFQEDEYPSLKEMTVTALRALEAATQDSEQGFFVMIEGSRIDHAGHANDPAAEVHEVLAYDHAMAAVLDFIQDSHVPTVMVSTSDHETGGLAAARQLQDAYPEYLWYPGVLANASHSAAWAASQYHTYLSNQKPRTDSTSENTSQTSSRSSDTRAYLTTLLSRSHALTDPTPTELDALISNPARAAYTIASMLSRRAQTGWTTHGHSGADVNIYASDPIMAKQLTANRENTEVGDFLRDYLGVGELMEEVTAELKQGLGVGVLGAVPEEGERLDGQDHLQSYQGHSRKRTAGARDYHLQRLSETPEKRGARDEGSCGFCAGGR